MKKNNLSQNGLALVIGVNQTTISQWLLGKKQPSYENILMFYDFQEKTLFNSQSIEMSFF